MLGIPSESTVKVGEMSEKNRVDLCFGEINEICKKYRCQIVPIISFVGDRVEYGFNIIPLAKLINKSEIET